MSSHLENEGGNYVPATEVGRSVGYSKDYILMLIRKGEIDGKKIGNKWYATIASAESYRKEAGQKKEVRREALRAERKVELNPSGDFMPATEVGKEVGYTKDYILMLIKQGKIDGHKVGHKWHASLSSAQTYFVEAQKEREERKRKLRAERKAELESHQANETHESPASPVKETVTEAYRAQEKHLSPFFTPTKVAVLETLMIVFLGLSVGTLGYQVSATASVATAQNEFVFSENVAIAVYDLFSSKHEADVVSDQVVPDEAQGQVEGNSKVRANTATAALSMQVGTTTHTSILLSETEVYTATTVDTVEDSVRRAFSDEVDVVIDTEDGEAVLVTPQFIDGEGETQRFKMVPADYEANSSNE